MRAVAVRSVGGLEKLELLEVPEPTPAADEVVVEVHAAGVNPVDAMFREGYLAPSPLPGPLVMGSDFAGRVVKLGAEVGSLAVGDEVFGYKLLGNGTYAERVAVKAAWVAKKPLSLSFIEAASLPCVALTAFQAVHEGLEVQAGETVLVTGAAGGVGTVAVQLVRALGARVVAVAGERNHGFVRELGAEAAFDHTREGWADAVKAAHPIDAGLATFNALKPAVLSAVRDGGRLVWLSGEAPAGPPMERKVRGTYVGGRPDAKTLRSLATLADAGKLRAVVQQVFPLEQARDAQALVATGHVRGKVVIAVR